MVQPFSLDPRSDKQNFEPILGGCLTCLLPRKIDTVGNNFAELRIGACLHECLPCETAGADDEIGVLPTTVSLLCQHRRGELHFVLSHVQTPDLRMRL